MSAYTNGANGNGARSRSKSFDALFRTFYRPLCAFACAYVRCPWIAEELVDDVFVRVWERRASWDSCVNKKRYLYAAVRNSALKHLAHERIVRTSHAMVKSEGRSPAMGQPPEPVDELVDALELEQVLDDAIDRLPPRCHEAFTLHHDEDMSYREIADIMGTAVRTVETQIARARKVLRRELAAWVS